MIEKNPADNPVWSEIGNAIKPLLRAADGKVGILLIERHGAVAALLAGDKTLDDKEQLVKTVRLFQERLVELADHIESGEVDFTKGDKKFVRDNNTGQYFDQDCRDSN